jgi:predicted flap endonuclease-1-like 5' DNA nuclease
MDPITLASTVGVGGAVVIAAAAAYSRLTGDEATVDVDDQEVHFGSDEGENPQDAAAEEVVEEAAEAAEDVVETAVEADGETVDADLGADSLSNVKGVGDTRADELRSEGFTSVTDLYYASDDNLLDVTGIGPYTIEQIREDIGSVEDEENESNDEADESSSNDAPDTDDDASDE